MDGDAVVKSRTGGEHLDDDGLVDGHVEEVVV